MNAKPTIVEQDFSFSVGIDRYPMNGTYLYANLADDNLYNRFSEFIDEVEGLEAEFAEKTKGFSGALDLKGYPSKAGANGDEEIDPEKLSEDQFNELRDKMDARAAVFRELDQQVKEKLRYVFGEENDFDAIFKGVCAWAPAGNGSYALTNFINAIKPLVEQAKKSSDDGVNKLVGDREARRARNRASDGVQS